MVEEVDQTLEAREEEYGDYTRLAYLVQEMKTLFRNQRNWDRLTSGQREALDMTAMKIARILNGDPYKKDSWHDAQGYMRLGELQCPLR